MQGTLKENSTLKPLACVSIHIVMLYLVILVLICRVMLYLCYFYEKFEVVCHVDVTGVTLLLLVQLQWSLLGERFQNNWWFWRFLIENKVARPFLTHNFPVTFAVILEIHRRSCGDDKHWRKLQNAMQLYDANDETRLDWLLICEVISMMVSGNISMKVVEPEQFEQSVLMRRWHSWTD